MVEPFLEGTCTLTASVLPNGLLNGWVPFQNLMCQYAGLLHWVHICWQQVGQPSPNGLWHGHHAR